jgi:hypothetical protein
VLWIRTGFNADPDPVFKVKADPDLDPVVDDKKCNFYLLKKNSKFFLSKIAIYLFLGLHE